MRYATSASRASAPVSGWRRLFHLPVFLILNISVLFFVGFSVTREAYHAWSMEHDIRALEAQAQALEGQKSSLFSLAQSFASPERVEFDARKFGWKKEGERVAVLEGFATTTAAANDSRFIGDHKGFEEGSLANLRRWWKYFVTDTRE